MENTYAPIFFIHQKDSFYIKYSINQAKFYNPNTEIIFLSSQIKSMNDNLSNIGIGKLNSWADEFMKIYIHLSLLPFDYEYFCFARWFILANYVNANNEKFNDLFSLDTDVLLYCDLNEKKKCSKIMISLFLIK